MRYINSIIPSYYLFLFLLYLLFLAAVSLLFVHFLISFCSCLLFLYNFQNKSLLQIISNNSVFVRFIRVVDCFNLFVVDPRDIIMQIYA